MNASPAGAPDAALVTVDHVTFAYPGADPSRPALDDGSLGVPAGELLGIIGPNGGGKTTLLRLILGLLEPTRGTVRVFGRAPAQVRTSIGYVPQHASLNLDAPATVLDVVLTGRLSCSPWGFRFRAADLEAARVALRRTAIEDLAPRPVRALSGGQRQRLLIARALAGDARLLILDEPTTGIDEPAQRSLVELLETIAASMPVIAVSHEMPFIRAIATRVACVHRHLHTLAAGALDDQTLARMFLGLAPDCIETDAAAEAGSASG